MGTTEYSVRRADGTESSVTRDWGCLLTILAWVVCPILLGFIVFSVSLFQAPLQLETEIAGGTVESVQTGDFVPLQDRLIINTVAVICMTVALSAVTFLGMREAPVMTRLACALVITTLIGIVSLTKLDPTIQWGVAVGGVVHQEQVNTTPPGPSPMLVNATVIVVTVVISGLGALWLLHWVQSGLKTDIE